MVEVKFLDSSGEYVDSSEFEAGAPDGIVKVEIDFGQQQPEHIMSVRHEPPSPESLASVANMIKHTARNIDSITIRNVMTISPEFLATFVALSNKTYRIRLHRCRLNVLWSGCLMGRIMNGLVSLEIEDTLRYRSNASAYKILFEAVAASPSLQRLEINDRVVLHDEDCANLVRALQRSHSLRCLRLNVLEIATPQEILRTSLWETELRELCMTIEHKNRILNSIGPRLPERSNIPLSILIEGLSREDCKLSKLDLSVFQYDIDVDLNSISVHNTSLVGLRFSQSNLTCLQCAKLAGFCRFLQSLDIAGHSIRDLEPLDEILLDEAGNLRFLSLGATTRISRNKWVGFFEKIPKMKSLERLTMPYSVFTDSSDSSLRLRITLYALCKATTGPQNCKIFFGADDDIQKVFFENLYVPLCLNRVETKTSENGPTDQSTPRELWSHVLERAMKLKYFSVADNGQSLTVTSTRNDAVYYLLREHMLV